MTRLRRKSMKHQPELCVRITALRKKAGLTIRELSEQTHVPVHHLKALEKCEYDKLPQGVYKKAILKKVFAALKVDPAEFIDTSSVVNHAHTKKSKPQWKERISKKITLVSIARIGAAVLVVGALMTYLGSNVYTLVSPPGLEIASPQEGQTVSAPQIVIKGQTDIASTVHINGIAVLPNNAGFFEQAVPLHEGHNTVTVHAEKRFGAKTELTRSVIFEPLDGDLVTLAPAR